MNAELFDDIIRNASFDLELFYDMKPKYYSFAGKRRRLDRNFKEIWRVFEKGLYSCRKGLIFQEFPARHNPKLNTLKNISILQKKL